MKIIWQHFEGKEILCMRIQLKDGTIIELEETSDEMIVLSNKTNSSFKLPLYIDGKTFMNPVTVEG